MPPGCSGALALAGVLGHISLASRQAAQSNIDPDGQYSGPSLSERLCPPDQYESVKTHCGSDSIKCKRMDEALDVGIFPKALEGINVSVVASLNSC
jgi:hypothetical protein